MVGPPSDVNVRWRLFLCNILKERVIPMIDVNVKQVIFLIVFIAIVSVPTILAILTRKKKGDNEKDKDKT
jgi:hypothetical protein